MHYHFLGHRQLSDTPYQVPPDTQWALYDAEDYLFYTAQYQKDEELFSTGDDRLRELLLEGSLSPVQIADSLVLFSTQNDEEFSLYSVSTVSPQTPTIERGPITLFSPISQIFQVEATDVHGNTIQEIPMALWWSATQKIDRLFI